MKGSIIYSSVSGNTKKLAERLAEGLADIGEWILSDLSEKPVLEGSDCVLLGAWIDRAMPNKAAMEAFDKLPDVPVGFFVTMGAECDSFHGECVAENLDMLLKAKKSLGYVILPGLVDPKVIDRIEKMPPKFLDEEILRQMIEAGKNSRGATEEEYADAISEMKLNIKNYF